MFIAVFSTVLPCCKKIMSRLTPHKSGIRNNFPHRNDRISTIKMVLGTLCEYGMRDVPKWAGKPEYRRREPKEDPYTLGKE
jgi:hypothetical protein